MLEKLSRRGREDERAARALPLRVLHLRRDQLRGRRRRTRRWRRSRSATPTREITHLDGVSVDYDDWHFNVRPSNTEPLLRLCLESLVSRRGHGAPARRGARADPLVSRATSPQRERCTPGRPHAGIHRLAIPTPFTVGRVNCYLIEDTPLTLVDSGPNSAQGARRARAGARARSATASRTSSCIVLTHQHMDHIGLASSPRAAAPARRSRRSDRWRRGSATTARRSSEDDVFAEAMMLRARHPRRRAPRAARRLARLPRLGRLGGRHAPAGRRRRAASCATARCGCCTGPATSPSDTVFHDEAARRCCSAATT